MSLGEAAVRKATKLGASEAEAYVERNRTVQISFTDEIQDMKTVDSIGLGLRVAIGKRLALYSTSILDEGEVARAAETAVKLAKVAPEDPSWSHFNRRYGASSVEGVYDREIAEADYGSIVEHVSSAMDAVSDADGRAKLTRGGITLSTIVNRVTNSYGEAIEFKGTYISASVGVKVKDGERESTGSESLQGRSMGLLDLDSMAVKATEMAGRLLGARPIPSCEMPVVLRNQISANMLWMMLSEPINADTVQKGSSPLSDKLGEAIAADDVHILDDGLMAGGMGTRACDDEGCPRQRTPILEAGVLKNFLFDSYTALKGGVDSTGNAGRRAYSSPPSPAPSNLVLREGSASHDEIIGETREGLYVDSVIGAQLSNAVSGHMNAAVTRGFLIEDGELGAPVKGVVLAGNFYDVLKGGYEIIGSDTSNSGATYSPTVKLAKLTVAGR